MFHTHLLSKSADQSWKGSSEEKGPKAEKLVHLNNHIKLETVSYSTQTEDSSR